MLPFESVPMIACFFMPYRPSTVSGQPAAPAQRSAILCLNARARRGDGRRTGDAVPEEHERAPRALVEMRRDVLPAWGREHLIKDLRARCDARVYQQHENFKRWRLTPRCMTSTLIEPAPPAAIENLRRKHI